MCSNLLYVVTQFIDGQTLAQWMIDNPKPDLATIRGIVEQIAKGLRAFHCKEMLHQDLRPARIDGVLKNAVHPASCKRYEALPDSSVTCAIPMRSLSMPRRRR